MSMTADAKFLMVSFEGEETLESALSVWPGNIIFYVCSFLAYSRTWGSNESM